MAAVRSLLAEGAGVDTAEADGTGALHWASYRDDIETAGLLLDAGADVNAGERSWGDTAVGGGPERQRGHGATAAGGWR